jgi:hypothetical protein
LLRALSARRKLGDERPKRAVVEYPEFANFPGQQLRNIARPPTRLGANHGFIYIIWHPKQYELEGVLKIGFASNLKSRLVAANTWSFSGSFEYLEYAPVSNMREAEGMLHRMHAVERLSGEWFRVHKDQARAMLTMVASRFPLTDAQRALLR